MKDNKLTTKAIVDSMGIYLTYKERYKGEQKVKVVETVIEKEVNVLKWWQKWLMLCGIVSILIITVGIGSLISHSKNISL